MESMMTKQDRIWLKLMKLGEKLGCHQMESRSFSFRGYQFPVCARCTGVFIGQVSGIISIICGFRLPIYLSFIFMAIMALDWGIQYLKIHESSNIRRFISGTLCGFGMTYLYFYVIKYVIDFLINI